MPLSKREEDFEWAIDRREVTANDLNYYLEKQDTGLRFERMQPFLKTMNIAEKTKNNQLSNYIIPQPFKRAMALHYNLVKNHTNKKPFIFCYVDAREFYLKLPKEYKTDPEAYLKLLEQLQYNVIIVDGKHKKYSPVIDISTIKKYWPHHIAISRGNKNRLQFKGNLKGVTFLSPEDCNILFPSLIDSFKTLMV
jgi:hypothetical protein